MALIEVGLVEPEFEPNIITNTLLCLLYEREPLVPKVHIVFRKWFIHLGSSFP